MSEFKTIETQEEFDQAIKERLSREKAKYSDYDQLKSRVKELEEQNSALQSTVEGSKGKDEEYTREIQSLKEQVACYETTALKQKIAIQSGIPFELAERLQGVDEDALKADAERLAGFISKKEPTPPLKDTEPNVGKDGAYQELLNNLKL